jgi:hypothetical protein
MLGTAEKQGNQSTEFFSKKKFPKRAEIFRDTTIFAA